MNAVEDKAVEIVAKMAGLSAAEVADPEARALVLEEARRLASCGRLLLEEFVNPAVGVNFEPDMLARMVTEIRTNRTMLDPKVRAKYDAAHAVIIHAPGAVMNGLDRTRRSVLTLDDQLAGTAARHALHIPFDKADAFKEAIETLAEMADAGLFDDPGKQKDRHFKGTGLVLAIGQGGGGGLDSTWNIEELRKEAEAMLAAIEPYREAAKKARKEGWST